MYLNGTSNICFICKILNLIVGVLISFAAVFIFLFYLRSYGASLCALYSGLYALLSLWLSLLKRSDTWLICNLEYIYWFGLVGSIVSLIYIFVYIYLGIIFKQSLSKLGGESFFMMAIWSFMSLRWSFLITFQVKNIKKQICPISCNI